MAQVSLKCFTQDSVSSLQAGVPNNDVDAPSGRILRQLLPQHFVEGGRRKPRTGDVQLVLKDRRPKAEDLKHQRGEALECLAFQYRFEDLHVADGQLKSGRQVRVLHVGNVHVDGDKELFGRGREGRKERGQEMPQPREIASIRPLDIQNLELREGVER